MIVGRQSIFFCTNPTFLKNHKESLSVLQFIITFAHPHSLKFIVMKINKIIQLHWKLYFPLVGLLWIIIGISIAIAINYEKRARTDKLENWLHNINASIIDAYERGDSLQNAVDLARIYIDQSTIAPLRLTVYDSAGNMIADNPETTILLHDKDGRQIPELRGLTAKSDRTKIRSMLIDSTECMVNAAKSRDKKIYSLAALPYKNEVLAFISADSTVWIIILGLGIIISITTFIGLKSTCRDIYSLQKFAKAISENKVPNVDSLTFSNDELGDVSRELVTLYRNKIKAEREKAEHEHFVSRHIHHELRTPIGIIKGYIDTVIDDKEMPEETKRHFLSRAKQNANRLAIMLRTVSDFTHIENGAATLDIKTFNLFNTINQIKKDLDTNDMLNGMEFKFDTPTDCFVNGNETLIINILLNLINNAVRYSKGSLITFNYIRTEDSKHHFTLADNGTGVKEEYLDKLFKPFYRIESNRRYNESGMGLGLSIVHRTITALGGNITVRNIPTGGLEFSLTLPVGKVDE